jgi:predicted molibdopterin-dependent oxidoreductase YjgC
VRRALDACELVVVSDCMRHTDTTRHAHVLLPALTWGEKDGTVTNSERRISRQRRFLPAPGAARADWQTVCDVAQRMGFSGFDYPNAAAIFREHARLSSFENEGSRDFDLSSLNTLDDRAYDALTPIQWPVTREYPTGTPRMFETAKFFTPDRKARFVPVTPRAAVNATSRDYPLVLNTGRIRDQWHTMTRTGKSARLLSHIFEPCAEFHPDDARMAGVENGATDEPVGRDGGARRRHRRTAARLRVRADALERRVCRRRPGQRTGQSGDRSDLRPAGVQAYAGQGDSLLAEMACVHPQPPGDRTPRSGLLGRRAFGDLLADGTRRRRTADELA